MMHGQLALSTSGVPLGLLEYEFIQRDKLFGKRVRKSQAHMNLPISRKESQRWIDFIHSSSLKDTGNTETIHIADREGDLYELYRECVSLKQNFEIRVCLGEIAAEGWA